jgi:hypothetical protein
MARKEPRIVGRVERDGRATLTIRCACGARWEADMRSIAGAGRRCVRCGGKVRFKREHIVIERLWMEP